MSRAERTTRLGPEAAAIPPAVHGVARAAPLAPGPRRTVHNNLPSGRSAGRIDRSG
jgi:hypothetical protein